jgi:hypothetical protein
MLTDALQSFHLGFKGFNFNSLLKMKPRNPLIRGKSSEIGKNSHWVISQYFGRTKLKTKVKIRFKSLN